MPWDFSLCLDLHSLQFSREREQHRTLVNTGPALGVETSGGTRSLSMFVIGDIVCLCFVNFCHMFCHMCLLMFVDVCLCVFRSFLE